MRWVAAVTVAMAWKQKKPQRAVETSLVTIQTASHSEAISPLRQAKSASRRNLLMYHIKGQRFTAFVRFEP